MDHFSNKILYNNQKKEILFHVFLKYYKYYLNQ
jgi:hypothetical protein